MNAITLAFVSAASIFEFGLPARVKNLAQKQPKFKEGWSFNGSYKTYNALKAQGKIS